MIRKFALGLALLPFLGGALRADFSYQETSKITGGAMASLMRVAGVFSRQAREPIQTSVAVKGDKMVHRSANSATVIDLGSETITTIDMQRKTYSVMTFEEMKQAMARLTEGNKDKDKAQMNFKVSADSTGKTKQVAGFEAKELVLKMETEMKDTESGRSGTMTITSDMWLASAVPGYAEVRDFQKRMAEKLAWAPGGNMFMANPQVVQGMAEIQKEAGKLDGMPVLMTVSMGGAGMPAGEAGSQAPAAQPRQETQAQPEPERPSLGGALGGALGGLGRFGRKKSQSPPPEPAAGNQPQPAGNAGAPGSLLEMTTELSGFSAGAVDASQFEVPAGFKKVEADMRRGR